MRGGVLVGEFVALVGFTGDDDDLPRIELEFGAGGAQGVHSALRGIWIGVETHRGLSFGHVRGQWPFQHQVHDACASAVATLGTPPWGCSPTFISQMEIMGTNFENSR